MLRKPKHIAILPSSTLRLVASKREKREPIMTDNAAVLAGYTEEYLAVSSNHEFNMFVLVRPGTDLDGTFKAWDMDSQEFVRLNGWNWTFEAAEQNRSH